LSPILSAIYTAPLLTLLNSTDPSPFTSFQLYVDDGCITASGETCYGLQGPWLKVSVIPVGYLLWRVGQD
jgi:hypothetical protein